VAGYGAATKEQMQRMVVSMLGLDKTPPEDAADALAIAICHIQAMTRMQLEGVKAL
jgi:crossover junction endodeoxyribonuclease RuvC